jgi:peptide/nickel transport system permease protein
MSPRALVRQPGAVAGLVLTAMVVLPALAAPLLPLSDPALTAPASRMLPVGTQGHPLGTDQLGRDLLSRLVWGARSSVAVALLATALAALIGAMIGILAGFFGRLVDQLLMRGIDVLMAFPYLLLALAIVAALGPGLGNAMLAIAVANVPFFARAVRGSVLEIRHQAYIDAARLGGHGWRWIIVVEVLPNLVPTILILMTTTLGWMVLETAGLSFLGLGAQPPQADLGSMLGDGRELLVTYPRVAVLPGLVILVLVVGINLFGDALRDELDPRIGSTRRSTPREGRSAAADAPGPALLAVRDLRVAVPAAAGSATVVDGVDFDIRRGERVALVGESGSGKTLTAQSLLRLLPSGVAAAGKVQLAGGGGNPPVDVLGASIDGLRDLRGRRIAYIPQEPSSALDPLFRVGDQLDEAIRAHADRDAAAVRDRRASLLNEVGLDRGGGLAGRFPHQLSGGQLQRIVIAMALAHGPDLLVADEATTALDVTLQAEILALLTRLCAEHDRALLLVSHDLALVAENCERVLVMYAGRIVEDAPAHVLLRAPAHPYTAALLGCSPVLGHPEKPLRAIQGQPPAVAELAARRPAQDCVFAPRCPRAQPVCREHEPPLESVGERRVRCLFPLDAR